VTPQDIVKTLIFVADGKAWPSSSGETRKSTKPSCGITWADSVELATDDIVLEATNSPKGFAGAIGIKAEWSPTIRS